MKGTDHFKRTIQMYLEQRAEEDTLFAKKYRNPAKNIDECVTHILNYVQKSGCSGFTDGEIFGQAIHYYEENEIEVGKPMNCQVVVNHVVELTEEEKAEFMQLSEALDEYGSAYHPLPGQMSTLLTDAILTQVKEKGLKQKDAARMIGISSTMFSDLIHGRRSLSFEVARSIHKILGIPADIVLA